MGGVKEELKLVVETLKIEELTPEYKTFEDDYLELKQLVKRMQVHLNLEGLS